MIARLLLVLAALAFTGSAYAQTWLNRVQAETAPAKNFQRGIGENGKPIFAQPTVDDILGLPASVPLLTSANVFTANQKVAPTTGNAVQTIDSIASQQASIVLAEGGIGKWQILKQTDGTFIVYDAVGGSNLLTAETGIQTNLNGLGGALYLSVGGVVKAQLDANGIRLPASLYMSFGAASGSTGYGIRDNAGVVEVKNSGGAWTEVATRAAAADGTIRSNISGASADPTDNTISAVLDKLFGATRGAVIYRGASAWSALAPGTAGYVLSTNGAGADPAWAAQSGGGGRTLVATLTASNSASLGTTTALSGAYAHFEIVFENVIRETASTNCKLQIFRLPFDQSGGSYQTTGYASYAYAATGGGLAATSVTDAIPCDNAQSNGAASGISGTIRVSNTSQTASPKQFYGQVMNVTTVPVSTQVVGSWTGGNGAVAGFQVLFSSGNITSGNIKIYGLN